MKNACASCGHIFQVRPLVGAFNTFIGEPRHSSSLYGAHNISLCDLCSKYEEK